VAGHRPVAFDVLGSSPDDAHTCGRDPAE
jgi:hypothetical protein